MGPVCFFLLAQDFDAFVAAGITTFDAAGGQPNVTISIHVCVALLLKPSKPAINNVTALHMNVAPPRERAQHGQQQ